MADVTISSLPLGTPSGNGVIPFSLGNTTYQSPISSIFQNRPAFNVTLSQSQYQKYGPGAVPFDYARINVGNYFDTTNYRFNVPYTGLYQINVFGNYIGTTAGAAAAYVRKNGNTQVGTFMYTTYTGSWVQLASSEVLSLNQGEYIDVYNYYNGYFDRSVFTGGFQLFSSFSGYFIG